MASDPVEIVAEELRVQREISAPTDSASNAGAWLILNTLYEAGWRIVLLREGVEFDPANPAIVDEWTPTGDPAVSTGEDPTTEP